jgi:hypothetical protein
MQQDIAGLKAMLEQQQKQIDELREMNKPKKKAPRNAQRQRNLEYSSSGKE